MRLSIVFCVLIGLAVGLSHVAGANEAVQSDWSGGDGVPGPVPDWTNRFAVAQSIDWQSAGQIRLAAGLPAGNTITHTFGEPAGVIAADLDGDQDRDVISVAFQGNEVVWWENDGTGHGWTSHTIVVAFNGACSLHACDIDSDGDLDVAATAESARKVAGWANDGAGGGWTEHVVDPAILAPFSVCAGDLDGDGDLDLCSAAFMPSDIVWWENRDGLGVTWLKHTIDGNFGGAWWADVADLDADGDLDVAGAGFNCGDVCWWANDGQGTAWTKETIDDNLLNALSVRILDMDGDADLDVLAAGYQGDIAWWSRESTVWIRHPVAAALRNPFSVRAADLDGDGDPDVISNERSGNRVMWYENADEQGTVWLEHTVDATSQMPNDVLAADLDGDGGLEIVATYSTDNSILWYEPFGPHAESGVLESSILNCTNPEDWGTITWTSSTPAETSVRVEVRASTDPADLGDWVRVGGSGDDLSDYIPDTARFFQYRLSLETSNATRTPSFDDVTISWEPTGAADDDAQLRGFFCRPTRNPAPAGQATLVFALPWPSTVRLSLFDICGRELARLLAGRCSAGVHSAIIESVPRGVYLYSLSAGELERTGKLVVS